MQSESLEADYLVVGCGAMGMGFADALVAESNATVIMIDRRARPGGHWNEAYPFVRLHQPSAFYGVNSLALGRDTIDESGPNGGFYEVASGADIRLLRPGHAAPDRHGPRALVSRLQPPR